MCGIAGAWWPRGVREADARRAVAGMAGALHHRGPDAGGLWVDSEAGLALAHRRLSILDLSEAGAQPMTSASGRFVIVFNGEIYNHVELRRRLERDGAVLRWQGHSDTETLLAATEHWGLDGCLDRIAGMFAFALWDRRERRLSLARDRLGEKPLYYGRCAGALVFGSELKALRALPGFDESVDPGALTAFVRHGYVPEPASIYAAARKLPPGCTIAFRAPADDPEPWPYWDLGAVVREGAARPLKGSYEDLCEQVEHTLRDVVRSQMLSDVPLGCFLSGGIDSSLTAAFMQSLGGPAARTFSIGFDAARFDESGHARLVARHLGTEHTEFTVTEAEALAVIPDLPRIYDEPFADSSQIPSILLSQLARRQVTVALTGDGGDEIFGGYNRHVLLPSSWRYLRHVPRTGRRAVGRGLAALRGVGRAEVSHRLGRSIGLPLTAFDKVDRIGRAVAAPDFATCYGAVADIFHSPGDVLRDPVPHPEIGSGPSGGASPLDWIMERDTLTYLPGDILVKVDRAAMSASLETRTPFLDRRIVELAWSLPRAAKVRGRVGKRILRDILCRYVPRELVERPKQGFAVPLDRWLRGELRDWAESHLSHDRLDGFGVFDARAVRRLWSAHLSGAENAGSRLWTVLMLQAWLAERAAPAAAEAVRA